MATIIIIWILNVHDGIDINRRKLRHKKIHVAAQSTRLKILNTLIKRRMFASNLTGIKH